MPWTFTQSYRWLGSPLAKARQMEGIAGQLLQVQNSFKAKLTAPSSLVGSDKSPPLEI